MEVSSEVDMEVRFEVDMEASTERDKQMNYEVDTDVVIEEDNDVDHVEDIEATGPNIEDTLEHGKVDSLCDTRMHYYSCDDGYLISLKPLQ